jgi:hypothetical protein
LFLLAGSKHSQYLRTQPSDYVGFPYGGWWREREERERGRGESIHPSTLAGELLSGTPYAGWCREGEWERKGGRLPFEREGERERE